MNNFDFLITLFFEIKSYPILLSISPVLFGSFLYFLGKIRSSNYWTYHLDNKYVPFLHGLIVVNNYLFNPIVFLVAIYNWRYLFSKVALLIFILLQLQKYIRLTTEFLIDWARRQHKNHTETPDNSTDIQNIFSDVGVKFKLFLVRFLVPLLTTFISFKILSITSHPGILVIVLFTNFLTIMRFATIDTLFELKKTVKIVLDTKQINVARIIEFLNDGTLIKYQNLETGKVSVVRTESIKEVVMLD